MLAADSVHLYDLTQILLDGVDPFSSGYPFGFYLAGYTRRLHWIVFVTREIDVVFRESATPLAPLPGEKDLECF